MGRACRRTSRDGLRDKARAQLGTVGSGNHYVDVFADETDAIWVGVHFGSRGFGHTVASGFLALSQGEQWGARVPEREVLLALDRPIGQDYWALMTLAGEYAYAGREWVARKVVSMLGGRELELVHNHHNFAWREEHDGQPADRGSQGRDAGVPGAERLHRRLDGRRRGDRAGRRRRRATRPRTLQRDALFSTVHGAGRVMSRTQAAGKRQPDDRQGAAAPARSRRR